jgi:hypothetical protein
VDNKENEQIENILKKSAEEIELKPFSERWQDIENRLEFDNGEKVVIKEQVPILSMQNNTSEDFSKKPADNKIKIFVWSICLLLVAVLVILIPISFHKTEPVYFGPDDLTSEIVSKEMFWSEITKSKIDIVDMDGYECEDYALLKTEIGEVQGGTFIINDDENLALINVTFYSSSVIISNEDFIESDKYNIDNTVISYYRLEDNIDLFEYEVLANHKNVTYELKYLSVTDNILEFFNKFFV